ncbi:MAG: fasciclin domain-containing protein [Prevotella sp.]|nr:fasciclin domain-containing protein [Prevotella sp.]
MNKLKYYLLLVLTVVLTGCYDEGVKLDNYYVFNGQTIGDYLDANPNLSTFDSILSRAGMRGLLRTYGNYTCLAPTNAAVDSYLAEHFPGQSVSTLSDSILTALAKSHIIEKEYLTSNLSTGYLEQSNMYDRKIQVTIGKTFDTSLNDSVTAYIFNGKSRIVAADDTVSNGVVHTIDHVLEQSSYVLPDYMSSQAQENGFTLFQAALEATHLNDSLRLVKDDTQKMEESLSQYAAKYSTAGLKVPASRKYGYTVFVERDKVFETIYDPQNRAKPVYTNNTADDLRSLFNYAKEICDEVYPDDAGKYDDDYTHPKNPLNRFIAYHILKRNAGYSDLVVSTPDWSVNEGGDYVEYYETLAGELLRCQKVSLLGNGIYFNRCTRDNNLMDGVALMSTGGASTINGNFQFIDGVLCYNSKVETMLRTERIRIDTGALLPELTNNSIRLDNDDELLGWFFPQGYFKDLKYDDKCVCFYNRWPMGKSAGNGSHRDLAAHETDNMNFGGEYDVTIRIPAVPAGQYEIRLGYVCNSLMSISQIYFGYSPDNMMPVGIPLDMNLIGTNPKVGMILDNGLFDDYTYDILRNTGGQTTISENDKAMRNLGYMKGPSAQYRVENDRLTKKQKATNDWYYLRRIITTQQLENRPFYLRFRKVDARTNRLLNLDFIEIVPRSVYNGATPEDRN